jgi:hypothetical protein
MSQLIAECDADVQAMAEEQLHAAGLSCLAITRISMPTCCSKLQHPFPPTHQLTTRLTDQYGF